MQQPPNNPPAIPGMTPQKPEPESGGGLAIASLILGILSWIGCWILAGIPGAITGHLALRRVDRKEAPRSSRGYAIAGLIMSYTSVLMIFVIGILAAILLPALPRARESARRSSCANNEKQMAVIFKMFSNESTEGHWPDLSAVPGRLMFDNESPSNAEPIYPVYLSDPGAVLVCPSKDDAYHLRDLGEEDGESLLDDHSYVYLGYALTNEQDLEAFVAAYKARIQQGLPFNEDLPVPDGYVYSGGDTIWKLKDGVERFWITDVNSSSSPPSPSILQNSIPVLWDKANMYSETEFAHIARFNHVPGGSNVLFMDGHVEFVKYPGKFPMTEKALRMIQELDSLGAQ